MSSRIPLGEVRFTPSVAMSGHPNWVSCHQAGVAACIARQRRLRQSMQRILQRASGGKLENGRTPTKQEARLAEDARGPIERRALLVSVAAMPNLTRQARGTILIS